MREAIPSVPAGDLIDSPRLVLRDGTVASVRPSLISDRDAIRRFFHELSPESRRNRFFTSSEPPDTVIDRMADSTDPTNALTLLVHRFKSDDVRPVAVASYMAVNASVAEVAFAVDDSLQGRGVSTALLERLAVHAARHGFQRFQASTFADNNAMLEVFRDSGFEIRSKTNAGVVDLQLSLTMTAEGVRSSEERDRVATAASLAPLLEPSAVAVVGVSRGKTTSIGRRVFDALRSGGFTGPIHPVNRTATEIDGVPCYPSARQLPPGVDLAVIAVPASEVSAVVDDCAAAGVKSLVVISAGFAEAGDAGRAQQHALVERVRNYGMRMVGPNCMGLLNARADIRLNASFSPVMPESGRVSLLSQSGALGIAIIELALERQVGLSTFVSVGNKADVSGNDLLQDLGARSAHVGDAALPRVVRQPAPLRTARAPYRTTEADRGREGGAHQCGRPRGRKSHGGHGGERRGGERAVPAVGCHPCRHHRRDVRRRHLPRRAAAAGGIARRDRHQCRRSRHPCRRRMRRCGTPGGGVQRRHTRTSAIVPAVRSQHQQSGRHDRVRRSGRVSQDCRRRDDRA
ncbi:MAG: GNAT family N-acetyltransferase [Vicinamibacterales bacterium]